MKSKSEILSDAATLWLTYNDVKHVELNINEVKALIDQLPLSKSVNAQLNQYAFDGCFSDVIDVQSVINTLDCFVCNLKLSNQVLDGIYRVENVVVSLAEVTTNDHH